MQDLSTGISLTLIGNLLVAVLIVIGVGLILAELADVKSSLARLTRLEKKEMATLDEALAKVTEASTKTASLIALFTAQKKALDDVLSGVTLPPGVADKINKIFDIEVSDAVQIDAALNANVPAPVPAPEPAPPTV